ARQRIAARCAHACAPPPGLPICARPRCTVRPTRSRCRQCCRCPAASPCTASRPSSRVLVSSPCLGLYVPRKPGSSGVIDPLGTRLHRAKARQASQPVSAHRLPHRPRRRGSLVVSELWLLLSSYPSRVRPFACPATAASLSNGLVL